MSATSEIIARVALWWVDKRPLSKEARERRKAKRAARKSGQAVPVEGEGISMQGYKTYTGILVALIGVGLGWFGVGESEAGTLAAQIGGVIDQVLTIGGLLFAAYGRAKAKPAS